MVAHAGPLEAKSCMLAASIRTICGKSTRVCIAVPSPESVWGGISANARAFLDDIGVEYLSIENPINNEYPHGNKIACFADLDESCTFLDSDMMILRPVGMHWAVLHVDASLKAADIDTFSRGGGKWNEVYRMFGLQQPTRFLKSTQTKEVMMPYFNAGFIWVRNGKEFSECWIDTARQIDAHPGVTNKRPWLDQIAIPATLELSLIHI